MLKKLNKPLLSIRASAGSGKTYALTLRYIYLLFCGAKPHEILCITFTKKAANEMKERIATKIYEIYCGKIDDSYLDHLTNLGISKETIESKKSSVYRDFLSDKNHIMTFDAFFRYILKKFSFYEGISSNYDIGAEFSPKNEDILKQIDFRDELIEFCLICDIGLDSIFDALDEVSKNGEMFEMFMKRAKKQDSNIIELFSELKREVIPLYCEVKEKFLEARVSQFSRRAKIELNEDSSINEILTATDKIINLTDNMLESVESLNLTSFYEEKKSAISASLVRYFNGVESQVLNYLFKLYEIYKNLKINFLSENNTLSFGDVSACCYDLLNNQIDKDFFYFRLDSRINHMLIDEFQDTNIRQYFILKPLIDEIRSGKGRSERRSVFFVGDEKQAIYGFRGSDKRLFGAISKEIGMDIETLKFNYRSAKNIVGFVNSAFKEVFENYIDQKAKSEINGFVSVKRGLQDEILTQIKERASLLLENGRRNIAILTRTSKSAKMIYDFLESEFKNFSITMRLKREENVEFLAIQNVIFYILKNDEIKRMDEKFASEHKKYAKLFLKNALKLSGKGFFEDKIPSFNARQKPIFIVREIMEWLELFDTAAIDTLASAAGYEDLEEFAEFLKENSGNIDEEKNSDIIIMNIHQAKGLEFEDVIVSEFRKEANDKSQIYFDYEGLELKNIYFLQNLQNRNLRASVDSEFSKVNERREKEKKDDLLNLLYVAFTRAKLSLAVFIPSGDNSTFFKHMELEDCELGSDEFSEANVVLNKKTPEILIQEKFGAQDDFIKKDKIKYNTLNRVLGNALHTALEHSLKYKSDHLLTDILTNKYGVILDSKNIKKVLENMNNIKNNEIFKNLVENSEKISCEASFLNDKNEVRRIDCLIESKKSVAILDYKSSDFNLEQKKAQIREYVDFIARKMDKKEVVAYLCFADGTLEKVD